jgi:hypothetical protein
VTTPPTPSRSDGPGTDGPVTNLRGATVEVDVHRTTQIVVAASLVILATLAAVLFVADADKSAQIYTLQDHGVKVDLVVTQCKPQLSGSGSSVGGYSCVGTFELHSKTYHEQLLGTTDDFALGRSIPAIVDPDDPGNVYPAQVVRTTHRTWTAFAIPIVLSILWAALSVSALIRVMGRRRSASTVEPDRAATEPADSPDPATTA